MVTFASFREELKRRGMYPEKDGYETDECFAVFFSDFSPLEQERIKSEDPDGLIIGGGGFATVNKKTGEISNGPIPDYGIIDNATAVSD